jgi:phosphate:Na+ symporter
MEPIASLLGGLGLFLVGIKGLGGNLQALAGPQLREVIGWATRGRVPTAITGLLLGLLTQSSQAATIIVAALANARLIGLPAGIGLLAWANPGTAGLVLLATVDLRLAVLWLVGLVGLLSAFGIDRGGRLKPALGALFGLGLMFLGLDLLKAGAAPLQDSALLQAVLGSAGSAWALPALLGLGAGLMIQSSSTIVILALTLFGTGLLEEPQAVALVLGASLGSGAAVLWSLPGLAGAGRRLVLFQAWLRVTASAGFAALVAVEALAGTPLLLAAIDATGWPAGFRIGALFVVLQLVPAMVAACFAQRLSGWLVTRFPESATEALSRPHFLFHRALADAPTALALLAQEQRLLLARLPALLDAPRGEVPAGQPPRQVLVAASAAVEDAARQFTAELLARGPRRDAVTEAVQRQNELALLSALRETLGEFGEQVARARDHATLGPFLLRLAESQHLMIEQLATLPDSDAEDRAMLIQMTADRSDMMEGIRRRLARDHPDLTAEAQDTLFRATGLFERTVWLTRRLALALKAGAG